MATKPSGRAPRALQPARQQHAERLVREPAFEGIGDHVEAVAARERLDQELGRAGKHRALLLVCAASRAPASGRRAQRFGSARIARTWLREIGGERELAALVGGDHRRARRRPGWRYASFSRMPSKRSTRPAKRNVSPCVSCSRKYSSILPSTRPPRTHARARLPEPHLEHRRLDDRADVQPVLLRDRADA